MSNETVVIVWLVLCALWAVVVGWYCPSAVAPFVAGLGVPVLFIVSVAFQVASQ